MTTYLLLITAAACAALWLVWIIVRFLFTRSR